MNKLFLCCLLLTAHIGWAQTASNTSTSVQATPALKMPQLDKSPMDMAYYPANYPVLRIQDKASEPLVARVIYSRPQKEGRTIFGGLVQYGEVWRFGANEATEIELYRDVRINNKKLPKGRYTLYAIPTEKTWTVIFNKDTDIWGAFKYDEKKDVLRVSVPVQKMDDPVDMFSIAFSKANSGADMMIAWDEAFVTLPFRF
ncbi:MAG TPA: DUF2911 domain-containing protein [Flavisolibacter sp.]|jgi:hypothetical protein|nr:DUF2911 domain-containing protein [Flavisolibacter sp.]